MKKTLAGACIVTASMLECPDAVENGVKRQFCWLHAEKGWHTTHVLESVTSMRSLVQEMA